jgi:hypothetical protein
VTQGSLPLTAPASDADVARVARRYAAAVVAEVQAQCGRGWLEATVVLDGALADLLLVTGMADAYVGVEHEDRPVAFVEGDPAVL